MGKKSLPRKVFLSLNLLFNLFCVSGLIWQISSISINYFKYDTVKDINVVELENVDSTNPSLTICFDNGQMFKYDEYGHVVNTLLEHGFDILRMDDSSTESMVMLFATIKDRFHMTRSSSSIYEIFYRSKNFMVGYKYCTQGFYHASIRKKYLQNVTQMYIARGNKLPIFDPERLITVRKFGNKNQSAELIIDHHYYEMNRLSSPYIDNCMDYKIFGYSDRIGSISACEEEQNPGHVSFNRPVTENMTEYSNYTLALYSSLDCHELNPKLDCHQHIYLTELARIDTKSYPSKKLLRISGQKSKYLSFTIISKARIEDIDFVTFILGALGAWIGFSFISVNPVPTLFKSINNKSSDTILVPKYATVTMINQLNDKHFNDMERINKILETNVANINLFHQYIKTLSEKGSNVNQS